MDLVLFVCLTASPANCREERLLVSYDEIAPMVCLAGAVPTIVEWSEGHPDRQVARWRCEPSSRRARR